MAYTVDQLNILEKAIASGTQQVRFNDRIITYHSLKDMRDLRDAIRAELGVASVDSSRGRIVTFATGKGL